MRKTPIIALLLIIVLFALGACGPVGGDALKLTVAELMAEYEADEAAANLKYMDKILEVTGTFKSTGRYGWRVTPYLRATDEDAEVLFWILPKEEEKALTFSVGDTVTLRGTCKGYREDKSDVYIDNCTFVD